MQTIFKLSQLSFSLLTIQLIQLKLVSQFNNVFLDGFVCFVLSLATCSSVTVSQAGSMVDWSGCRSLNLKARVQFSP